LLKHTAIEDALSWSTENPICGQKARTSPGNITSPTPSRLVSML
jgi:hypothetical protein